MKVFAIIFVLCAVSFLNLAQTNKPKPKTQTAKPKATPSKKSTAVKFKPKTTATPAKKNTAAKSKPSAAPSKPPTTAKQKSSVTPPKKPDEKAAWEKAVITDPRDARIAALQKFNETFPKSTRKKEALTLIALLRTDTGNEKLAASETDGAAAAFRAAATDAPKPIPEQLWTEALSKIAANLYFRGARESAIEIEKTLESKADGNLKQLLDVANFYMMIENGGEARRVSLNAIALDPNSSVAYQTLGLANRIDFQLFGSASAYERALELDPTSLDAKRGLAEMKRALGKADESVALYREILTADANSLPAQTGLILALFDADKRADAEAELARSLEVNPGNVILLAGAAYWYAAHNEGVKAVELAGKAIDSDPRFIWSHIALARGLLMQNRAADAEKALLAARRYGNFPTVEYELASARLAAGYYREAAEGLRSVFKITDGKVSTNLGGRVARDAHNLRELVGDERRASIFASTAADDSENAARLAGLLELRQQLDSAEIKDQNLAAAVDQFVKGGDRMKVYRQIFAASQLLEKKTALLKVLELTKAATLGVDDGLAGPNSTIAVMANELYESRAIAATKGEYIVVPDLPRHTLSAVLRGRVEEIAGWAQYNLGSADEAIIRLRRAIGVLPADSTWWRSSTWRLGAAYALAGKNTEALEMYIKSYKSAERPDVIRYGVIESQYRKVNGSTEGLADKIGPNLVPQVAPETIALKTEAAPIPTPEVKPDPTPEIKIEPAPTPDIPKPIPSIVPVATPSPEEIRPVPTPLTEVSPTPEAAKPTPSAELSPSPSPETTPEPQNSPTPQPTPDVKTDVKTRELFPPVIITIPVPSADQPTASETKPEPSPTPASAVEPTPSPTPVPTPTPTPESPPIAEDVRARIVETKPDPPAEIVPCKITVSEETINLKSNSGKLAVIVGLDNDNDVDSVQASSSSPKDVMVRREPIAGLTTRALFVLQSLSDRLGVYQVTFEMPCGKRTIAVNVR